MVNPDSFYIDIKRINIAHEFVVDKDNRCEYPNGRKYYGIIYCISGKAVYRFSSGSSLTVVPGDVLWFSPEASYSIYCEKEFRHYTVNFEIHADCSDISLLSDSFYLLKSENHELYRHIFKKLTTKWQFRKTGFEMRSAADLYELLAVFASEVSESRYHTSSYFRLRPAKEYIEQNVGGEISIDLLANCVNMSVTNFRREWSRLYGESAIRYRDRLRLDYAKEYLISGYYTVAEVALKCGFKDVNYFIRFFKKHTGISPGKFAKNFE